MAEPIKIDAPSFSLEEYRSFGMSALLGSTTDCLDVVASFSSSGGSEAVSSLLSVPNDDSGMFLVISYCPVYF